MNKQRESMLKWALNELLGALPERRDWFNPDAERQLRTIAGELASDTIELQPVDRRKSFDGMEARQPTLGSAPQADHTKTWRFAANEWADTAYDALQGLRNIEEGVTTDVKRVRENTEECCKHAQQVADAVYRAAPQDQAASRAAVPEGIIAIGRLLKTQDNRCTDQPMFVVQQRRRITGLDTDYCDNIIWLCSEDEYSEASQEEAAKLEAEYQETGRARRGWIRTGYMDQWEFVTACFTEQGCKDYLACDGHNLKEPRIYAEGSYRNEEFRSVRNWLMSLAAAPVAQEGKAVDGWISVQDRMPKDRQDVIFIVDCPHDEHMHGRRLGGRYIVANGGFSVPGMTVSASYWKPMPAAPAQQDSAQVDEDGPLPNEPKLCSQCDPSVGSVCEDHGTGPVDQGDAAQLTKVKQNIEAMLLHFTSTPSNLADSIARGKGHQALGIINRLLEAWPAPTYLDLQTIRERDEYAERADKLSHGIAKVLHYPECWDTAAYPTVDKALVEVYAYFKCSTCAPEPKVHTESELFEIAAHFGRKDVFDFRIPGTDCTHKVDCVVMEESDVAMFASALGVAIDPRRDQVQELAAPGNRMSDRPPSPGPLIFEDAPVQLHGEGGHDILEDLARAGESMQKGGDA